MLAAIDTYYHEHATVTAVVQFADWSDAAPADERVFTLAGPPAAYVPGEFFRRELPPILAALEALPQPPDVLVIDGYVWLDADHRPGLGAVLHQSLPYALPIIGVAKTRFQGAPAAEVLRGQSRRPLFVTAVGMDLAVAAACIAKMHGEHRMPTLLKRVDELSRRKG